MSQSELYYGEGVRSTRPHAHRPPEYVAKMQIWARKTGFNFDDACLETDKILCAYNSTRYSEYSSGATTSLSEFYATQPRNYRAMIFDLEHKITENSRTTELEHERAIKQKRSAILKRLQKYGIDTTDWNKVNTFLEQPRIAGKRLYTMTITEMQELIKKLESILKKETEFRSEVKRLELAN